MEATLPKCVTARRMGYMETEYDQFGELAPVRWFCDCGSVLFVETLNWEIEKYVSVSEEAKAEFLANHNNCQG